ncbi:amino acid ABC transporter permease, partial [Vibrio sp. M260118]|uniref:amino acid ABC transporter permease n=1 Tax=Vibrio sp. M260118 TaxID=3020896 RepID=UPI002F3E3238
MTFRYLLLTSLLFLSGCSDYQWGWYVLDPTTDQGQTNLTFLLAGFNDTIQVSLLSMLFAMTIGLVVTLPALSPIKYLRAINRVYVETVRSVPVLVLLLWVYYGMPTLVDISLNHFWAGVIALTIAESAFMAEVFRGGIQAINRGQHEAAESLGLNYWQKMRLIVLPQAFRQILPPLGNQFVYILKMSSLVSVIGLSDLTRRANELVVNEYLP